MPLNDQQLDYQKRSARIYQQRYDDTLRQVGMKAPEPILGQSLDDYRRETLRTLKRTFLTNHVPSEAIEPFEKRVLSAVVVEAFNPKNVPLGEMRKIEKLDDYGKVREIQFIGQESFVKDMTRPGRRVTSFRTDFGFVDASGRPLR